MAEHERNTPTESTATDSREGARSTIPPAPASRRTERPRRDDDEPGTLRPFWHPENALTSLEERVLPFIVDAKGPGLPLRAWVPGCATGEGTYSLAILFAEQLDASGRSNDVEIFGTDVDASALELARSGSYLLRAVADAGPVRHARFFHRNAERCRVNRRIRDSVVFSVHDLLSDPPLSRMDLVWCTGLTIGRSPELAERMFPLLARALTAGGMLVLGASEHVSPPSSLFESVAGARRFYRKREQTGARIISLHRGRPDSGAHARPSRPGPRPAGPPPGALGEALLLQKYAPPSAIVDESGEVLKLVGSLGALFEAAPGEVTTNLVQLTRLELREAVREALHRAVVHREPVTTAEIAVDVLSSSRAVRVVVTPLVSANGTAPEFVVAFEETVSRRESSSNAREMLQSLLERAREDLVKSAEEFQFANEELRAANEELLSTNEELRASNEDLDGVMEELRTTRDDSEAMIVDLSSRLDISTAAIERARNPLSHQLLPMIVLDQHASIVDFSPGVFPYYRMGDADRGRPLSHLAPAMDYGGLDLDVANVLAEGRPIEKLIEPSADQLLALRVAPRTSPEPGVEITFYDVSAVRRGLASQAVEGEAASHHEEEGPASSALGNFAAEIAHEIRDPLNTIAMATQYALQITDPARIHRALETIRDAASRCSRIVDSVLGLVRQERSLKWLNDLHVVVRHAAALMSGYFDGQHAEIEWKLTPGEALAVCNPTEIEQVFVNLMKNSVQATHPKKSHIVIRSEITEGHVMISVCDDGPGIPKEIGDRVFDRMYSTHRQTGGTGLGLPLAREITEVHGGRLELIPSNGAGTTLHVILPRARP